MQRFVRVPVLAVLVTALACLVLGWSTPSAREITDARGHVGLALVLRQLATAGTVMHVTAHPDDENNPLMAMQSHGKGLRVVLATATRGTGGQNEIGPELFDALGVLRTEELLAAHEYDGAEQYFARAVDFGYTFSIEETFENWGKDEILGDYVRLIRMTRPDVLITMRPDLPGGGKHHQASALIGLEAFRAAGDAAKYPEQLREGLRPWQAAKIYKVAYYGFFRGEPKPEPGMRVVEVDSDVYDPLLGKTYLEIGSQARAMHKCQGFGQLLALPGPWRVQYQLADTTLDGQKDRQEKTLVDGLDLSVPGLARFAGSAPPEPLVAGLKAIAGAVAEAEESLRRSGPEESVPPLARGLAATRTLRKKLPSIVSEQAAFEIDFRLSRTERLFNRALVLAQGVRIEALADDGVVAPGQQTKVRLIVANRGGSPLTVTRAALTGFEGNESACEPATLEGGGILNCEREVTVPAAARLTEPYWERVKGQDRYRFDADAPFGAPFRPSPFRAEIGFSFEGVPAEADLPVQYRYEGNIFSGEKRMELQVVPAVTVSVSPDIAILPVPKNRPTSSSNGGSAGGPEPRDLRVTVRRNAPGEADVEVRLNVPEGWSVEPQVANVHLERQDEAHSVTFTIRAPASLTPGTYSVKAVATAGGATFDRGFQVVEYPHIHRRHIFEPATVPVKALDVAIAPDLLIGYVMGVGDQVPQAIEQLGARLRLLSAADLASGDLSVYDAIVTGVRAYERRADLRAYNHRLIEYARAGGTVIVQYNKFEFNQAQYGPFPAKVSSNRVTDEASAVKVLVPDHPVFTWPNRIDESAWHGWVQERGLYFLGERDSRYVDLLELVDPFPENAGPKRGALVEATVGKGRWLYVGLGLFRQLPAGTDGAYRLLANLLSL